MTQEHPITPPLELLKYWEEQQFDKGENYDVMLIQAYQAGADMELEACCEWLKRHWLNADLRAARRPEPPSLKEQGLKALDSFEGFTGSLEEVDIIRRALESLPE